MGSYSQSRNRPGRNSADSPFSDQACKGLEETGGEFLVVVCDQKTEVDTSFCHKWHSKYFAKNTSGASEL